MGMTRVGHARSGGVRVGPALVVPTTQVVSFESDSKTQFVVEVDAVTSQVLMRQ